MWFWASRAFILLNLLVFVKTVSPSVLPPLPSPSPHMPPTLQSLSHIHLKHMKCHCKGTDIKTTRKQSVVPAQYVTSRLMMRHPVSKNEGVTFQRRSPRTHLRCTYTLGTKNGGNDNLQVFSYQSLWRFVAILDTILLSLPTPDLTPSS